MGFRTSPSNATSSGERCISARRADLLPKCTRSGECYYVLKLYLSNIFYYLRGMQIIEVDILPNDNK